MISFLVRHLKSFFPFFKIMCINGLIFIQLNIKFINGEKENHYHRR